jgi:hypothetical protein
MRPWLRENLLASIGASIGVVVVGWLALNEWLWNDYDAETRPAFDALVHGHLGAFLHLAPAYGGSLVLRAPFVLGTRLWGGGELAIYRAAAAPCLIASALLAVYLAARMRGLGSSKGARAVVLFLCVANPITISALEIGHPEELLGAVLCVAAVMAAMGDRPIWAGVLLGLAVANKEWALLAVGPVLLGLPRHRVRGLVASGAVAGAVLVPLLLAGSQAVLSQAKVTSASTGVIFQPWQVWWFLGSHGHVVWSGHIKVGYRIAPIWLETFTHPLIVALSVPLTLLCVWLRKNPRPRPAHEPLLLLSLLLLIRCVLDPWDISYYSLPFLIALLSWEALSLPRPPVLALTATALAWFVFQATTTELRLSADAQSVSFLAAALPALAVLSGALYAPGVSGRLGLRLARRHPLPAPA